jgi:hypothetical protein
MSNDRGHHLDPRTDGGFVGDDSEVINLPSPPAISDANDTPPNLGSEDNVVDVPKK